MFAGTLRDASTFVLETSAAEAWCALGEPSHARVHANRSLSFASGPFQQAKSKALSALCIALHGDIGRAVTLLGESDLPDGSELDSSVRGIYPRALARVLIASASADARELRNVASDLRFVGAGLDYRRMAAEAALVQAQILEGSVDEGIASGMALLSLGARAGQAMVRALLASVIFDAYLIRGEPRRALSVLEAQPEPPGSVTCGNVQRAYAYSLMRDDRRVLRETSMCMSRLTGHSIRVMVPLAMVRGLSCFRLGQRARARQHFIDGLQLALRAEVSFTSFIGLDAGDLKSALLSLDNISPELTSMVAAIIEFIERKGGRSESVSLPRLTGRERELAWGLYRALSNSELASSAGSSVNTVKAQLRTLYKKLNVTDRKGAVEYLDARDFFLDGE
ncbi:helix-turn-helix transcriptional regulator [Microbacterium trichothecenolyticum]|uniref:helix-turn-helix transcriptional regulator n=1 Tax=Microbacterium trichothecenolyticum TaxID=69370 RepID=UPI0027D78C59|nr:helix-turn-helix transcriptional regulator [Microbacterium trichothecenolyticum]